MSVKLTYKGKITKVDPISTVGKKGLRKRFFAVCAEPDSKWPDEVAFELIGGRTDNTGLVTELDVGRTAEVTFYISSRCWKDSTTGVNRWFSSVTATGVKFADEAGVRVQVPDAPKPGEVGAENDNLPF